MKKIIPKEELQIGDLVKFNFDPYLRDEITNELGIILSFTKEEVIGQHLHLLLPKSAHAVHAEYLKKYEFDCGAIEFDGILTVT